MRRVICDIFMIITTITTPGSEQEDAVEGCTTDLVAGGQYATPHRSATPEPPQCVADGAQPWIIYQELILVHCQRDPVGDPLVIDDSRHTLALNFSDDSSPEA